MGIMRLSQSLFWKSFTSPTIVTVTSFIVFLWGNHLFPKQILGINKQATSLCELEASIKTSIVIPSLTFINQNVPFLGMHLLHLGPKETP